MFPLLKIETKQGLQLSTVQLNVVLEILVSVIRQKTAKRKERKESSIQIGK